MISRLSSGRRILTAVASICLLSWIPTAWSFTAANNNGPTRIQVCQNKDCVKNFPNKYDGGLTQLLQDLIPVTNEEGGTAVVIEASGCLSKCNNGPNVCCRAGTTETIYSKVNDILMAAAILEVGADVDSPGDLMAAIEDMAKASQGKILLFIFNFVDVVLNPSFLLLTYFIAIFNSGHIRSNKYRE